MQHIKSQDVHIIKLADVHVMCTCTRYTNHTSKVARDVHLFSPFVAFASPGYADLDNPVFYKSNTERLVVAGRCHGPGAHLMVATWFGKEVTKSQQQLGSESRVPQQTKINHYSIFHIMNYHQLIINWSSSINESSTRII